MIKITHTIYLSSDGTLVPHTRFAIYEDEMPKIEQGFTVDNMAIVQYDRKNKNCPDLLVANTSSIIENVKTGKLKFNKYSKDGRKWGFLNEDSYISKGIKT